MVAQRVEEYTETKLKTVPTGFRTAVLCHKSPLRCGGGLVRYEKQNEKKLEGSAHFVSHKAQW
jgi:uncharacterized protein YbbK (DUF523 family)